MPDLDATEQQCRVREMRALALAYAGASSPLTHALLACDTGDTAALADALAELDALPALQRRRLLSAYAMLSKR
jgi:hypothetical protein